jgi:polar amino acid transport system substrate-binding protein
VGDVPTGFERENYYRKELELRMSCSYGPGRHDRQYEEHGLDYPIGYVRWTENRNMQAFLQLAATEKLRLEPLITHVFPFDRAPEAYDLIVDRSEPFSAILLEYDVDRPVADRVASGRTPGRGGNVALGVIGAGAFGRSVLLPLLKPHVEFVGVATARPAQARYVADRFGFRFCTGEALEVLSDPTVNAVAIATRHDMHAPFVLEALRRDLHVLVEKPLCLTAEELAAIADEHRRRAVHLMVGFNRRFSRHVEAVREFMPAGVPKAIHYRINAGALPRDHWIHDPRTGGGRIIGEVCHFVDLTRHLTGAPIEHVSAQAMASPDRLQDTVTALLRFADGSIASIAYCSNGHRGVPKERLELFSAGRAAVLDDFKVTTLYGDRTRRIRSRGQDKGHAAEMAAFARAVRDGGATPIPFDEIHDSMRATLAIRDALRAGGCASLR